MGHLVGFRAAVAGKHRVNKVNSSRWLRKDLIFAAVTLLLASIASPACYAQSGLFAGLAGVWSGSGSVTLDDGSTERIRCRATYAVSASGTGLNQSLTCASDSYRFNLSSNVVSNGGSLSGTWSETGRGVSGNLEGRGSAGSLQITASAPGFTANISLKTTGNKQSVVIRADSQFKGASVSLSRS